MTKMSKFLARYRVKPIASGPDNIQRALESFGTIHLNPSTTEIFENYAPRLAEVRDLVSEIAPKIGFRIGRQCFGELGCFGFEIYTPFNPPPWQHVIWRTDQKEQWGFSLRDCNGVCLEMTWTKHSTEIFRARDLRDKWDRRLRDAWALHPTQREDRLELISCIKRPARTGGNCAICEK